MCIDRHWVFPLADEPISTVNFSAISSCNNYKDWKAECMASLWKALGTKLKNLWSDCKCSLNGWATLLKGRKKVRLKSLERQILRSTEGGFQRTSETVICARWIDLCKLKMRWVTLGSKTSAHKSQNLRKAEIPMTSLDQVQKLEGGKEGTTMGKLRWQEAKRIIWAEVSRGKKGP